MKVNGTRWLNERFDLLPCRPSPRTFISPIAGRMANKYGYRLIMMIFSGLLVMGCLAYIMATTSLHVFLSQVMLGKTLLLYPPLEIELSTIQMFYFGSGYVITK